MNAIVLAIAAGLCWGIGELFTRSALHTREIGPLAAIALRSSIALPLLWVAYFAASRSGLERPIRLIDLHGFTIAKIILGSGLIAGALGMIFFYCALNLGEASRIKPVAFSVAPAAAVLFGWLILREPLTYTKAAGVLLILAGVVLLTGKPRPLAREASIAPSESSVQTS